MCVFVCVCVCVCVVFTQKDRRLMHTRISYVVNMTIKINHLQFYMSVT